LSDTPTLLPADLQETLATIFRDIALEIAGEIDVPADAVNINVTELALALEEARKDLDIMVFRRTGYIGLPEEKFPGLSVGKLAGILTFRLARYRILSVAPEAVAQADKKVRRKASKLQEITALRLAFEAILKIKPQRWNPEVLYILSRRHTNQEMLGVTFDVMVHNCPQLKTRSPLDQPPFDRFFKRG